MNKIVMSLEITDFGGLPSSFTFPKKLIDEIDKLPKKPEVTLRFVDFDGTLMDDDVRFSIDPELRNHRKHKAISYIKKKYPDKKGDEEFSAFLDLLNPKQHVFTNAHEVFDPENPHHYIHTAGYIPYQRNKIQRAGYNTSERSIFQFNAQRKPINMLRKILELGFIPGRVEFIDDRIQNFQGVDSQLQNILGIPVDFYQAIPDYTNHRVIIHRVAQEVGEVIGNK